MVETRNHSWEALRSRFLSAFILAPIVIGMIFVPVLFYLLIAAIVVFLVFEWNMICGQKKKASIGNSVEILLLFLCIALSVATASFIWGLFGICFFSFIFFLVLRSCFPSSPMRDLLWLITGFVYFSLFVTAIGFLYQFPDGISIVFWILLTVWATDIGAYFVGIRVGGPKLAPRISPKKTWSGLLGGIVSAAIVSVCFSFFSELPLYFLFIAGVFSAIISQGGDLMESAFKRRFQVKDSGTLIPGHGGLLDRVDGLLAVVPIVALLLPLFRDCFL